MTVFEKELELFRHEEEAAQQHFFAYLALHRVPFEDDKILNALNTTPLVWLTLRYGALVAAFITLGRIFDERSEHNLNTLLRAAENDLAEFSRLSVVARKVAHGLPQAQAQAYAAVKHELTIHDVRALRKAAAGWRKIWDERYREIRHKVYAHRGLKSDADEQTLFRQTNIGEIVQMLAFLSTLQHTLWEALFNGRPPDLTIRGPEFPIPDRDHNKYPGERVYLEAEAMLRHLVM